MKSNSLTCLSLLLSIFATSCAKTSSDNVKTSGFYGSYSIRGNNQNSVNCSVQFQVGGPTGTYLDLSGSDSVTCNGNNMSRSELLGVITYSATVPYTVGGTYTVVLTRSGEAPYTSTAVLPEAITGMNPGTTTSYRKGASISPSWTASANAADAMGVTLSYSAGSTSYSHYLNDTAPENGSVGFNGSQTQVNPPVAGTWSGTIEYSRRRAGTMDPALSGVITASQNFTANISLTD